MSTLEAVLRGLSAFAHRGSARPEEFAAAQWLRGELEARGLAVRVQPFNSPDTYSWDVAGSAGLLGLGALAAAGNPLLGALLALGGASWFHAHFSGLPHPLEALVPRRPSQNLVAHFGTGPREVVLMAHYDSARSALLYAPGRVDGFRRSFVTNAALAYLTPLLAALAALAPDLRFVLLFLGLYFLANAALFVLRERREPIVNGANDNASGVAAAVEVALRLRARGHGRVTLLLTGCEEVGARGAAAYAATLEANADTLVLNLDNVGAGALHLARGEGMLGYSPYRPEGLEAARTALQDRLPELEYRLAYFDTRPFARRGLPCLSLIALEGGRIPNWHWPSDTLERVDVAAVTRAADAAEAIALQWLGAEPK